MNSDNHQRLINKCRKLYGRSDELRTLKKVYENAKNLDGTSAQLVFVAGESGSGKTAAISFAFQNSDDSLYGNGKFDKRKASRPFTAIINAFGEICNGMALRQQQYSTILHEGLQRDEIATLTDFIPELENVVEMKKERTSFQCETFTKQRLERLRYCLRQFLLLISRKERPLVIFLDDLQWVDNGSLSILRFLLADHELKHCVFVGAYRSNEVDPEHIVARWIEGFKKDASYSLTQISLGNLNVDTLSTILSDLLRVENTVELAELIHKRTNGNIFHMLQLVDFLQSKELLKYNMMEFKWTWDIDKIRDETVVSENVLEILRIRFQALPTDVQTFLKLSACLGFRFEKRFLQIVVDVIDPRLRDSSSTFDSVVKENLIEHVKDGRYKFSHDSIHQAALNLMEKPIRYKTHLKIGESLYQRYGQIEEMDARTIFLVADQLNLGMHFLENNRRLDVAKLNFEAGKQAAKVNAFSSAADYFQMGISLLDPDSCWTENYDMSLQLYTCFVQMCINEGKNLSIQENINLILSKARCVEDCLPVYFMSAEVLLRVLGDYNGHLELCLNLMKTLSGSRPSLSSDRKRQRLIKRTKAKLMSMSDEEILSLPVLEDVRAEALVRLAFEMYASAFHLGQHKLHAIIVCRAVETILDVGLCPYGSLCIAFFGNLIIGELDDVDTALRCCRISMSITSKLNAKSLHAALCFQVSLYSHWRLPFTQLADSFFDGYTQGVRSGDIFHAFQNVTIYLFTYYYAGLTLGPLLKDIENFINLYSLYGTSQVLMWLPTYQHLLNLTGKSDDILDMSRGKAIDVFNKVGGGKHPEEEVAWSYTSYNLQACLFCEAFDKATKAYEKVKDIDLGLLKCSPVWHARVFYFALICMHNAKTSRFNLKARREAVEYVNLVRDWVIKKKAINLAHRYILLKAEMMTLSRRKVPMDHVIEAFNKAIVAASRAGFIQDAALAAHLASRAVDGQKSIDYFNQALVLYNKWGAYGVVEYLIQKSKSGDEFTVSTCTQLSEESSAFRSRERFDSKMFDDKRVSVLP